MGKRGTIGRGIRCNCIRCCDDRAYSGIKASEFAKSYACMTTYASTFSADEYLVIDMSDVELPDEIHIY